MKKLDHLVLDQRKVLAQTIYKLRLKKGLSQQGLALEAGVDRKTINRIECGHFSPSLDTLVRLSEVLSVKPSKLLG
jgi:transcriptional regulator with XRE-family HTH domain